VREGWREEGEGGGGREGGREGGRGTEKGKHGGRANLYLGTLQGGKDALNALL